MNDHTDLTITATGKRYRIGRVSAAIGNWIAFRIGTATEQEFLRIQQHLLTSCSEYNAAGAPMPIMMVDGRWANKDLEYDIATVGKLFSASFEFNIKPFLNALASDDSPAQAGAEATLP